MQARTGARAAETAALLEQFGIELSAGGLVVMTNFAKAESAYIHHSRVPVAVVAMALHPRRLPVDGFPGHSLRAGYATSAAARVMPGYRIQQHTRHKSAQMVGGLHPGS
jgi:integrase